MADQKEIKSINEGLTKMLELMGKLETEFVQTGKTMDKGFAAIEDQAKKSLEAQKKLTGARKEQRDQITKEQKQAQTLLKAQEDLRLAYKDNAIETLKVKKVKQDMIKTQKLEIAQGDGAAKTYEQLSARYRLAAKRAKDLTVRYGENNAKAREAVSVAKGYNDKLKEVDASLGEHGRNVGNYQSATEGLSEQLSSMPGVLGDVAGGVDGLGKQFLRFAKQPHVAVLLALAGAATFIASAFKGTRVGSALMRKEMTKVSSTVDIAKNNLGNVVAEAANTEGGFKKLLKATNVLNIAKLTFNGTLKKGAKEFKEQREEVIDLRMQLIDLNSAYIDIENESLIRIANLQAEADQLAIVADDDTKSMAEMIAARIKLTQVDLERTQEVKKLSDERLKISELEVEAALKVGDLRKTATGELISVTETGIEIEKAYSEAKVAAIEASNAVVTTEAENAQKRRMVERDVFEQRLDLLLDVADRQKTINEQQLADDRISLDERMKILEETNKLVEDSFNAQVDLFQADLGIQLDRNKILDLNNAEIVAYAEGLNMSEIATNRLREVIMERRQAVEDLAVAERDLTDKTYEAQLQAFENSQILAQLRTENAGATQKEITKLTIEAQIERYEKELELAEKFNQQLSDTEIAIVKERIKALKTELERDDKGIGGIWAALGFDEDSRSKAIEAAKLTFKALKDIFTSFADERVAQADRVVESRDREVEAAENELNRQVELANLGYANNVENAQRQLDLSKESQKEAIKEREKAAKLQRQIDSAEQVSSLITASANILKGWSTIPFVGQLLGIAAIATMLGSFVLTKTKIASSAKQQFGEGGVIDLEGGSHASGNDIHFGSKGGKDLYAEGGEKGAIFNKKASRRYGGAIDNFVKDANKLQLEDRYSRAFDIGALPIIVENNAGFDSEELKGIKAILRRIELQGGESITTDHKGRQIVKKGNIKRIIGA